VPYSLTARTWSDINMAATLSQDSHEPGATMTVRAVLTEYDVPVERRATVRADLRRPDDTHITVPLEEIEPGVFEKKTVASMAGTYAFRVLAAGNSFRGVPFTREQTVTGSVWRGGDTKPVDPDKRPHPGHEWWCLVLSWLLGSKGLRRRLEGEGLDLEAIEKELEKRCRDRGKERGEGAERPGGG
jgi:hypothetical protein